MTATTLPRRPSPRAGQRPAPPLRRLLLAVRALLGWPASAPRPWVVRRIDEYEDLVAAAGPGAPTPGRWPAR